MLLDEYLRMNNISRAAFAKKVDLNVYQIGKLITGIRKPGKKTIKIIVKATKGKVTPEDLLEPSEKYQKTQTVSIEKKDQNDQESQN